VLSVIAATMKLDSSELVLVAEKVRIVSLQDADAPTFVKAYNGQHVATGFEDAVIQHSSSIPDLVGIAFDTLRQFCGGSSNDEEVIKATVAAATRVARRTGAFVMLPHHTGKQHHRAGQDDMYTGTGSAALADNSRFVLVLRKLSEDEAKKVGDSALAAAAAGGLLKLSSARGSLRVSPPDPMYLHRDGYLFERVVADARARDIDHAELQHKVMAAIRDGAHSRNAIENKVGGRRTSLLGEIDRLLHAGLIAEDRGAQKLARGVSPLRLTAAGSALLAHEAGSVPNDSPPKAGNRGTTRPD